MALDTQLKGVGSKPNPGNVGGPNEYAGFNAPKRADQSTSGKQAGSFYPGSQEDGNVVDRNRINKTRDRVSTQGTKAYPGGESTGSGY